MSGGSQALRALSYLGILIREVQAWGTVWLGQHWREPGVSGCCRGPCGTPRPGLVQHVQAQMWAPASCPSGCHHTRRYPGVQPAPSHTSHALAAHPTDSEHPFLSRACFEQRS